MNASATAPITLRLSLAMIGELDRYAEEVRETTGEITRTALIRRMLEKALSERKKRR